MNLNQVLHISNQCGMQIPANVIYLAVDTKFKMSDNLTEQNNVRKFPSKSETFIQHTRPRLFTMMVGFQLIVLPSHSLFGIFSSNLNENANGYSSIQVFKYSRMDQVKFAEDSF